MTVVYAIVVFNFLHVQQGVLPERYPTLDACRTALSQKQFGFTYWGNCQSFQALPASRHGR